MVKKWGLSFVITTAQTPEGLEVAGGRPVPGFREVTQAQAVGPEIGLGRIRRDMVEELIDRLPELGHRRLDGVGRHVLAGRLIEGIGSEVGHDARRTVVRDLTVSCVPTAIAMGVTGHRTESVSTVSTPV